MPGMTTTRSLLPESKIASWIVLYLQSAANFSLRAISFLPAFFESLRLSSLGRTL